MKHIKAYAIRTTVGGVHLDSISLDPPTKEALDEKLEREKALYGERSAKGDLRWARCHDIALLVDESRHTWAWEYPEIRSEEPPSVAQSKDAHLPEVSVRGVGSVS